MKACLKFTAAVIFLSATVAPAFAQDEPSENVTVFAPYVVKKKESGPLKERVTTVSVSRDVSFKDLDLSTAQGKAALEARVQQTAKEVCAELNRRFPANVYIPVSENRSCVKDAMNEVTIQVRGVEKAASGIG